MALDHLAILRRELAAFAACLDGDLTAPVEHCGAWTVRDLAEHVGQGNLWAARAVTERRGDYWPPSPPADLGPWLAEANRELVETLSIDPGSEAWTFAPPRTVGFWRRRRALETLVHRWDAEHALGRPSELDPELCADGVAEVIEMFVPRQVRLGRCDEPRAAVRFTATDGDGSWVLGPGEPIAELAGPAPQIMLALWGRASWRVLRGDHDIAGEMLRGPLVP